MKKKELLKKLSVISMAAMMTVTAVPVNTFAADIEFSDREIETQENGADISVEEDAGGAEVQTENFQAEESSAAEVTAEEENADFSADAETALFSDVAEAEGEDTSDTNTSAAAMKYLQDTYLNDSNNWQNKVLTNGGTGVSKSTDGLTYTVGLRANGNGVPITSLLFNGTRSPYRSGYYIDSEEANGCLDLTTTTAASRGSVPILKRPAAGEAPQSFKVTLRLFPSDTADSVINDETQAAKAALVSQEFTIILEAAEPNYTMSIKVVDEEGNLIPDAEVKLTKGMSVVFPKEDGSYDMEKGGRYWVTVRKKGYNDYSGSSFVFNPTELNTVKTVTLTKEVVRNIKFNVTDKFDHPIDDATVQVKKGYYETINPETDGSYNLADGTFYSYTVEAEDYKKAEGYLTPSQDQTIDIQLESTKSESERLREMVNKAQVLLDGITEGTETGQYPEGTKTALQTAIDTAKELLNKENVTEKELSDATWALQTTVNATQKHVFDEGKVTKEPTCAEEGEKTYTCSNCGATRTEKIARTDKHTYDKGVVTKKATYTATGVKTYTCTVCGTKKTETIPVVKHSHKYVWKTISKATVFQPQKQKGTCSLCKKTVTRNYGSKLKATIKLNVSSITLQKKQATKRVRVSMANGDSIRSWVSSNRKIVTVDKNGLIRAQNRNGSAKITVTLRSGKRATLKVKVQSGKVRTTKISGLKSSMTLKKDQKTTLKPVISPLTSTEKVTYATSNKKIATVSSKGVITAKKKGTAKITVRSGKKSYVIKVTVK